jgi:hypothetical protein
VRGVGVSAGGQVIDRKARLLLRHGVADRGEFVAEISTTPSILRYSSRVFGARRR